MLTFATEVPLATSLHVDDLLHQAKTWLVGSPHRNVAMHQLPTPSSGELVEVDICDNAVVIAKAMDMDSSAELAGFRHTYLEDGKRHWTMELVGRKELDCFWCAIRVSCETVDASPELPDARKPHILKQLVKLGTGMDGPRLRVGDAAIHLDEGEIDKAAKLIGGAFGNRLPIVYVSAEDSHRPALDAQKLARTLSGMAHVIVEPSRSFSFRLRYEVNGLNPYGGAVGIFWPGQAARRELLLPSWYGRGELAEAVVSKVQTALLHRRPSPSFSWQALVQALSRQRYEALKAQGSTDLEEWQTTFEGELAAKEQELSAAENEIRRLKAELTRYEAVHPDREGLLGPGKESDLYPGERSALLLDILSDAQQRIDPESRRATVLADLVKANGPDGKSVVEEMADQVHATLKGFRSLGKRERSELESLGFEISSEGKHHKLVFRGDSRYSFTLPKTSSDHRAGKNASSLIRRKLF